VFVELQAELIARPSVTAHRLILCHLNALSEEVVGKLSNGLVAKNVLTCFLAMYVPRLILEKDELGIQVIDRPRISFLHLSRGELCECTGLI
jgi:hypothetical protein